MPSFDITSEFNPQEVLNAVDQMNREIKFVYLIIVFLYPLIYFLKNEKLWTIIRNKKNRYVEKIVSFMFNFKFFSC